MMKLLKFALLLIGLLLLAMGGEGIYHAARSRQQIALSCEQFTAQPPRTQWIRVSGCEIDYLGAGYRESDGQIVELFFPMRPVGQPRAMPAGLLMATRDPEALAVAQSTIGAGQQPEQEAFLVMMLRIVTMLKVSREVEGYARAGVVELMQTRRSLTGLGAPLADGAVVVDLHARPGFLVHGTKTGLGLFLLGLSVVLLTRRRRAAESPTAAATPDEPGMLPAGAPARRLPGLMFLNVDPAADASAVEHAPPIGIRGEVTRRIADVFPGFRVDGDGRGTVRAEDWSLTLHLGADEKVWTVTVEARGDGTIDALETLASATGWRIFVPKRGVFANPADLRLVDGP
jgi:hypothetical protein